MRYSKLFGKTLRETPRGAGTVTQRLLMRAGAVKAAGPGVFIFLPLGHRALEKMNSIMAGEFSARGVQFLQAPPPDAGPLREQTPGAELKRNLAACRSQIRQQYFLAAHHEDDLCVLAGALPMTYRELPLILGLSRWRCREEGRGSAAFASARQFLMHAVYAFDADEASAGESCALLHEACRAAFQRMGAGVIIVRGASGHPGAPASEEFMATAGSGDEEAVVCDTCEYSAGLVRSRSLFPAFDQHEDPRPIEAVHGPGIVNTAELASFVGIPHQKTTKTLLFQVDDRIAAVCVRGEYDVSEVKLAEFLGCSELKLAPAAVVKELTGADVGYAGPIGLPNEVEIVWDLTTEGRVNFEAGANRTDYHNVNVNFDRDVPKPGRFADVRKIKEGEICAACRHGKLTVQKAVRLGHVSQLGTMYSRELKANFASRDGKSEPILISSCGVDVIRLFAAIVEQHSDEKGIAWPDSIAPFAANLISLPGGESRAGETYEKCMQAGLELLWDDRNAPAGAKFADADLIGMPVRLVISSRTGDKVEWKGRRADSTELIPAEEAIRRLISS